MNKLMDVEKIKVVPETFPSLMSKIQSGELRIPRFQRERVWNRKRVQDLLDSMCREYPIGTLFFWKAPPEYNYLWRDDEDLQQSVLKEDQSYLYVLDGQQRLTFLYSVVMGLTIDGDDYSKIVVDLDSSLDDESEIFAYRSKPDNRRWVAVCDLLSPDSVIFEIYDSLSQERRQHFTKYRNLLRNYPFSTVQVESLGIEDAITIFERINQRGRRLSRYDLIAASTYRKDFDLRERVQEDIIEKLDSFGEISETGIPQTIALNIKKSTTYSTQMSLTAEEIQDAWDDTVENLLLVADYVRSNFGVERVSFLPYDAMLPVLAHYFYYAETRSVKSPEHQDQIERWFWRAAFSERYGSASQTRMTEDAARFRRLVDEGGDQFDFPITTTAETLMLGSMQRTRSAARNGILCLLNVQRPRHFESGAEINLKGDHFSKFTLKERHHIFPIKFLQDQGYETEDVHRIPNFCFIPAELNKRIADKPPSVYMSEIRQAWGDDYEFEKVMRTHLIPIDEDSGIWTDDYEKFLEQRARLLFEEIRDRARIISRITSEQRNPVVDTLEEAIRDYIHETLSNIYGLDYWRQHIPGDVKSRVERLIEKELKRQPGLSPNDFKDARQRLNFCDFSDYSKIIVQRAHWRFFEATFRSKEQCERFLRDFGEFRNAVKHNREVSALVDHLAQAAAIWLSQAMGVDLSQYGIS